MIPLEMLWLNLPHCRCLLDGIGSPDNYPGTNQRTTLTIKNPTPGAIEWGNWTTRQATCPGAPVSSITNRQTSTEQTVVWDVNRPSTSIP
jgi:hypothetical protein